LLSSQSLVPADQGKPIYPSNPPVQAYPVEDRYFSTQVGRENLRNTGDREYLNTVSPSRIGKKEPLYIFTGGSGSPGISTMSIATALTLSSTERVNLVEIDDEYPCHQFLTDYQHRSHRDRFSSGKETGSLISKKAESFAPSRNHATPHPWSQPYSTRATRGIESRSSHSSSRTGFGLRSIDYDNYENNIEEIRQDGVSIFDIGRLPILQGLMNDRRRKGMVIHDLLNSATNIIYCVKAESLQLTHLQRFLSELNNQKYNWEITFLFTMFHKTKKDKALFSEFRNLVGRSNHLAIDFDMRFSDNFPSKQALPGSIGKQIAQLVQMIR
jgi:hypothetical protein